ncbi:MAG TPA: MFS transporter [Bacteroidales bacterium]|nr:MFS transporter [Bacteroidales bacterium]
MHNSSEPRINKSILLAVVLVSSFFNPFMGSAVNIALPSISRELSMNAVSLSWIAMAFLLSSAVLLVPFGKLADIWGRRRMLLVGNIFFTLSTLLCAFSVSGYMLITSRFIQGIGSAMILSSGMAIIISAFPPEKRGKIIGLNTSAVYVGLSAAPLLGGVLTQAFGWQSLFFINAAAGMLIIAGIVLGVKAEWAEAKNDRFDLTGSVIYVLSMSALMYGFSKLPGGFALILTITGSIGLIFFIAWELRQKTPVLNIGLFRDNRIFAFSNLAALINYAATFGITFILSLYLQSVKGLSPRDAGLIMITQPVMMAIVASVSGRLSDRIDSRILSSSGMAIIVAGLISLVFLTTETSSGYLVITLLVLGFGFGMFSSPNTNSVMSSVEKKFLGTASATLGTMRLTGQMFSMAIAAMSIHLFIGDAPINEANIPGFMHSVHIVFIVFVILCFMGIFASLARGRKNPVNYKETS